MTLPIPMDMLEGQPWAISPENFRLLLGAPAFASAALHPVAAGRSRSLSGRSGVISIIPVRGVITHRESLRQQIFGGTSIERLTQQFRQALGDRSVLAIVFDIDSFGGEVAGVSELAEEIFRSRSKKKTVAVANCEASSGAFWLASAAAELVVTPSGLIGSIGIVARHEDNSVALAKAGIRVSLISAGKYKTDGNPYEPLAAGARAHLQSMLDTFHEKFIGDVARGRGVQKSTVRERFGEGRSVLARQAVAAGMADRVATFDQTIFRLTSGRDDDGLRSLAARELQLDLLCMDESDPRYWEKQKQALDRLHASTPW